MYIDICTDICTDMCTDVCIGMCRHAYRHIHGTVDGRDGWGAVQCRQICRHTCRHTCQHTCLCAFKTNFHERFCIHAFIRVYRHMYICTSTHMSIHTDPTWLRPNGCGWSTLKTRTPRAKHQSQSPAMDRRRYAAITIWAITISSHNYNVDP